MGLVNVEHLDFFTGVYSQRNRLHVSLGLKALVQVRAWHPLKLGPYPPAGTGNKSKQRVISGSVAPGQL